jgi:hypothetical protein
LKVNAGVRHDGLLEKYALTVRFNPEALLTLETTPS